MNKAVLFSTGKDDWGTPPDLFDVLNDEFGFTLDVAASPSNHLCAAYLTDADGGDALRVEWSMLNYCDVPVCWCNPPYSKGLQHKFVAKAATERLNGVTTVMLLPARTDTRSFHDHIWQVERHQPREGVEVRFLKGRLKFVGATAGAPFPSMIVVFRGTR